jgi:hypothetical protein
VKGSDLPKHPLRPPPFAGETTYRRPTIQYPHVSGQAIVCFEHTLSDHAICDRWWTLPVWIGNSTPMRWGLLSPAGGTQWSSEIQLSADDAIELRYHSTIP